MFIKYMWPPLLSVIDCVGMDAALIKNSDVDFRSALFGGISAFCNDNQGWLAMSLSKR